MCSAWTKGIDTSTEDEPEIRMEEGEVERLLRVEAEAEVEERGAAEDGDTAGEEEEEVL